MGAKRKINYAKWRALSLSTIYLVIGIHIAHWKLSGRTLAPLEFNEVLYTIHLGIITAGFIFMGLTLLATVVAGRFFCSWMCHIIALQDASAWVLNKFRIKPKHFRSRILLWIPFLVMIYLFIFPQIEHFIRGEPAVQFKILSDKEGWASFMTSDFWRNLPGAGITLLTFFVCGFMIIYFLGTRSFCQYACPYGAIFSLADRVAPGKILLTGNCNQCGACTAVCQSHISVNKEVQYFGRVVNPNCLKDLDCVQACPDDALKFGLGKPSFFKSLSKIEFNNKIYDFTLAEDGILALSFITISFVFRGLYDSIPFLLAIALAILFAYFLIVFIRFFKTEHVHINQFVLKQSNKLTIYGKIFSVLFALMIIFSIHSAFIHYHAYKGDQAYNKIAGQINNAETISINEQTKQELNSSFSHLKISDRYGLYTPASLYRQLAAISLYKNDKANSKIYLDKLLLKLPDDTEARLRYAKLLYVTGMENAAMEHLRQITLAQVITNHDKKIRSDAWNMLGHLEEKNGFFSAALQHYNQSLDDNSQNHESTLALGIILTKAGKLNEAEKYLIDAAGYFPGSPVIENNLSVLYMKQHKYALAEEHLQQLLLIQPENIQAQYNFAMMHYAEGNKLEAAKSLRSIIKQYPDFINAKTALAMIENENYQKIKPE